MMTDSGSARSYTINEWCSLRKIGRTMFYKLRAAGLAPRTHNVGVKVLISAEADREWLRQREAMAGERVAA